MAVNVGAGGAISYSQGAVVTGTGAHSGAAYPAESAKNANGTTISNPSGPAYGLGNHGHGVTVFSLYTNQQAKGVAPHGNYDSDYYSHFSFVRSLQDIFGLADPGQPGTYMNRAKYTENFIQQNATLLPEFAGSSNAHFDGVRAMNHVYQFPASVTRVSPAGGLGTSGSYPSSGPDSTQTNLWAVK